MSEHRISKLNRFQNASAPRQVSDESFADLREQLADEELFFKNSTYSKETVDPATGVRQKVWFDKNSNQWIADFTFPDGTAQNLEADSRDDLLIAIAAGHGEQIAQEREAELESNPVFNSLREKTVHEWITRGKWGRDFDRWCSLLSEDRAWQAGEIIKNRARKLFGHAAFADPRNLEKSYIEVLDEGLLDEFEREAAQIQKQNEQLENARAAKAAKKAEHDQAQREQEATISERQRETFTELETNEARRLASTREGMRELRRRAIPQLSGEAIQTLPMRGTAARLP